MTAFARKKAGRDTAPCDQLARLDRAIMADLAAAAADAMAMHGPVIDAAVRALDADPYDPVAAALARAQFERAYSPAGEIGTAPRYITAVKLIIAAFEGRRQQVERLWKVLDAPRAAAGNGTGGVVARPWVPEVLDPPAVRFPTPQATDSTPAAIGGGNGVRWQDEDYH